GNLKASIVCTEYLALLIIGFSLAALISKYFFVVTVAFGVMGFLYNVRPFRTKERVYLDVLSESVNNPIRLMLGWFIVTSQYLPPSSLVFAYWMAGAFLMNTKRYAEYRFISNPELAGLYRRSFKFYTEERLLVSSLFYSMCFAFFFGVFLIKHRIELLLSLPLFAYLFTWYLYIGMKYNSPVQNPEKLYKERGILVYIAILVVVVTALFYLKIPLLHWFLENSFTY
ncbi:MAG: prenyltransferase, partial [Gammaproteobacteria bacterium]|nr:prenyltransferase [Gammaproteobacteria bacterium]